MTRDDVVKTFRDVLDRGPLDVHVLYEALREAIALLDSPTTDEIRGMRSCVEKWTPFVGEYSVSILLRAFDALAREPGLEAEAKAREAAWIATEDGIKERLEAEVIHVESVRDRACAEVAALEAKLARVRRLCAGIDDPALIDFAHDVLDALDDKPADPEE